MVAPKTSILPVAADDAVYPAHTIISSASAVSMLSYFISVLEGGISIYDKENIKG